MMSLQRNYYEVLGLPPGATSDQIKKKYRELARKFHPDVVQDKVLGQRVFTQINQAYSILGNPERRAQYNGTLQSMPPSSAGTSNANQPSAAAQGAAASRSAAPSSQPAAAAVRPTSAPSSAAASPVRTPAFAEMLGRAENAIMAGKPVEARAFCVRILEADPRHGRAMEILGDALVQMGRKDEAAAQYRNALQIGPSTLIQAKLNRLVPPKPAERTTSAPPPPRGAGQKTVLPSGGSSTDDAEKPGGLLGRILGRK